MPLERKIKYEKDCDREFADWVTSQTGGENLRHCIQCGVCSAACPLSLYMDYTPRRLINMARAGFKKEVLSSFTIWLCTSCYSCRAECPKQIKVTDIMYLLKRRAIEEGVYPKRFPIPVLAREFGRMIFTFGRVDESLLVANLFLRTNWLRFLDMAGVGFGLMRKGRMSFVPHGIEARGQLRKVLEAIDSQQSKEATR